MKGKHVFPARFRRLPLYALRYDWLVKQVVNYFNLWLAEECTFFRT